MLTARKHKTTIICKIRIQTQKEQVESLAKRISLAVQIDEALQKRSLTNQELSYMMGKKPSEISRWLSGTHNFTTETLWEIERVLKIQILTSSKPYEVHEVDLKAYIVCEVEKAFEKYNKK